MPDKPHLVVAADAVKAACPPNTGFIIITLPFDDGTHKPVVSYTANIARPDAVKMLKEILFRWGINEEWMTKCE